MPDGAVSGERVLASPGQRVDPPPSPGRGGYPATGKQAGLLKTVQRRIDRALGKIERLSTLASDFLDHRVAVRRARRERSEHDHVEMPLEHFAFHTSCHYAFPSQGSRNEPGYIVNKRSDGCAQPHPIIPGLPIRKLFARYEDLAVNAEATLGRFKDLHKKSLRRIGWLFRGA